MNLADLLTAETVMAFADIEALEAMDDLPTMEEQARIRAHRERIKHCGQTLALKPDPTNGLWKRVRYFCGYVRECPICRQRKADKIEREMLSGGTDDLYVFVGDEEETHLLCKAVGTVNYRRFPMYDGRYTVVYRAAEYRGGVPWDEAKLNLYDLVVAPEDKRITGKLGKRPPAAKDINVKLRSFIAPDVSAKEWQDITQEVFKLTSHFKPDNPLRLQLALDKRANLVEAKLRELGKPFWTMRSTEGLDAEELDWSPMYFPPIEEDFT